MKQSIVSVTYCPDTSIPQPLCRPPRPYSPKAKPVRVCKPDSNARSNNPASNARIYNSALGYTLRLRPPFFDDELLLDDLELERLGGCGEGERLGGGLPLLYGTGFPPGFNFMIVTPCFCKAGYSYFIQTEFGSGVLVMITYTVPLALSAIASATRGVTRSYFFPSQAPIQSRYTSWFTKFPQ